MQLLLVRLSDIHYINITGTSSSPAAVKLMCNSQFPCQNVQFYDIDLRTQQRGLPAISTCEKIYFNFTVFYKVGTTYRGDLLKHRLPPLPPCGCGY